MKTYIKFLTLGIVTALFVGVFLAAPVRADVGQGSYDYYGTSYDTYFPSYDNYGTSYDTYSPSYDYYGTSYDTYTPYYDNYGTSYDTYTPYYDNYGTSYDTYTPYDNYSTNPCFDYCGGSSYQPLPSYTPSQTYFPPSYQNYPNDLSYGCLGCSIPNYSIPSSNDNANANSNTNDNANSNSNTNNNNNTSNSNSSATATNTNNINNTFSPTFNPTNVNSNVFNPTFNPTINFNPAINNNAPVNVTVNVPNGQNQTNNPNLTAYCVASPNNPLIGTNVIWQAFASGGSGTYSYSWSGSVSGNGQTISNVYYISGTQNASVTVFSNGQQVTANCTVFVQPNGATVAANYIYQQPYQPVGTPSAGVFLNQIPATGIKPGLKMALFTVGLLAWSAFAAYMILQKKKLAALATIGISASEMDFDEVESETEESEEQTFDIDALNDMDLESNLSFRARENDVLISRDGIEAIVSRVGNNIEAANSMLDGVISKLARNEGNYATLNGEKINQILG